MKKLCLIVFVFTMFNLFAQEYNIPFYKGSSYDAAIPKPADVIGYSIGEKPINYGDMVHYITQLSEKSSLISLHQEGQTHQGRKLYYMIITSENNRAHLEEIKKNNAKLTDPRTTGESEVQKIIDNSPLVAMMMYSIHGNETSGTDAGIQLAYQLVAGTDETTKNLLDNLVIIIYPMENPDGRERFLHQRETWLGKVANDDTQSMPHSGVWPSGRTNHYHFDLNRDWFIQSQPETRSRVKIVCDWNPQLVVDAHEQGSFSSFLFNPPREPINPNMDIRIQNWWKTFASDQARAFDQYGWSYFTREWLEEWYPGYGSSYPSYRGAISILYEQARTAGIKVKRPDGVVLTFAEAVHHQFVSSIANLNTAAINKSKLLKDFYAIHKDAVSKSRKDGVKSFIIDPGNNTTRSEKLVEILLSHGVEVYHADEDFSVSDATDYLNKSAIRKFSKQCVIIPVMQPTQKLINAIMEFDTRMTNDFLKSERESLEKGEGTKLYEVSSWSLPVAFGLDVYTTKNEIGAKKSLITQISKTEGKLVNNSPLYGYLINYENDNAAVALLKLYDSNVKVRSANKTFKVDGNSYKRGTLLIRNVENSGLVVDNLARIAKETGIDIVGVNTALSESGSDLGGDDFPLLAVPKIAMLAGSSISMGNYGALMHLLDNDLKMKITTLNADYFGRYDLRKYNVLIIPSFYGGASGFKDMLGTSGIKKLNDWLSDGGTLIAIGGSSAAIADSSMKMSSVKLRSQSIKQLAAYSEAQAKESKWKNVSIDSLAIWEGIEKADGKNEEKKSDKEDVKKLAETDKENRKFMPQGAIVKLNLDEEHWLNFGQPETIPALYTSGHVLLSKSPVQTAARLADKKELRLSGLLWPEAKERMSNAAYLTRESKGNGQIILFAEEPNFRSYFEATERLFLNSVLLGPGLGTRQPVEW